MLNFQLNLSNKQEQELRYRLEYAEKIGSVREAKRCLAILAISESQEPERVVEILQVSLESIRQWLIGFLTKGISSLIAKPITGRPPKLSEEQRIELSEIIKQGPQAIGFPGACWRTPMIKYLIEKKYNVIYSVKYLSEFLKTIGFSYQKATFVAANRDEKKRKEWIEGQWPKILKLSKRKNAHILFGDEASFPQWGTLNYTWAPVGEQPIVKTSGTRRFL